MLKHPTGEQMTSHVLKVDGEVDMKLKDVGKQLTQMCERKGSLEIVLG